jgi:hypothetical protein
MKRVIFVLILLNSINVNAQERLLSEEIKNNIIIIYLSELFQYSDFEYNDSFASNKFS